MSADRQRELLDELKISKGELETENGNCTNLFCTDCLTDYLIADYVC